MRLSRLLSSRISLSEIEVGQIRKFSLHQDCCYTLVYTSNDFLGNPGGKAEI